MRKIKMNWEKCRRDTKCIDCRTLMHKGDYRLKTLSSTKTYSGREYPRIDYRCLSCGKKYILRLNKKFSLPNELKPKRYLRPIED